MPGALVTGDELRDGTITLNKEMRRHLQASDGGEIRVLVGIQTILKKRLHLTRAELPGRQADVMDTNRKTSARRPLIKVGDGQCWIPSHQPLEGSSCIKTP